MPDGVSDDNTILTLRGIEARILADGYEKGIVEGEGPWRKIMYEVAWGDSDAFMDALRGVSQTSAPNSLIIYPIPHQYPHNLALYCMDVVGMAVGGARPDPKLYASDLCHVSATYRVPRWDVPGTDVNNAFNGQAYPHTRMRVRGYTESVQVPTSALHTVGEAENLANGMAAVVDGDPLEGKHHVSVPIEELTIERFYVPYLNTEYLKTLTGSVNSITMLGRDPGTILFEEYDTDPEVSTDGTTVQTYHFRLKWRLYDWNRKPVDNGSGKIAWAKITDADKPLHPYVDLTPILTFGL